MSFKYLVNPNLRTEDRIKQAGMLTEFTPVGDARAIAEIPELLGQGRYGAAGVNALSALPMLGFFGDIARLGREQNKVLQATPFYHGTTKDFDKFDLILAMSGTHLPHIPHRVDCETNITIHDTSIASLSNLNKRCNICSLYLLLH